MRARKRFGQHFLEPVWIRKVIAAIDPQPDQTFLEIGPGRGELTRPLAAAAARVVAIEIDRDLAAALGRDLPSVELITGDVLDVDLAALGLPAGTRIVGNLPYNVSSPILFALLDAQARTGLFADATLMLQHEVAERLAAGPGSREYGVLSISVALGARVSRLLTLPPGAFRPRPAVTSAVVRLTFLPASERPEVPETFKPLVRALFSQRRKTVANGLRAVAGPAAGELLAAAGIEARRRPETLSVDELLRLAGAASARLRPRG